MGLIVISADKSSRVATLVPLCTIISSDLGLINRTGMVPMVGVTRDLAVLTARWVAMGSNR